MGNSIVEKGEGLIAVTCIMQTIAVIVNNIASWTIIFVMHIIITMKICAFIVDCCRMRMSKIMFARILRGATLWGFRSKCRFEQCQPYKWIQRIRKPTVLPVVETRMRKKWTRRGGGNYLEGANYMGFTVVGLANQKQLWPSRPWPFKLFGICVQGFQWMTEIHPCKVQLIRIWCTYWLLVRIGLDKTPDLLVTTQSWYIDSKIDSTTCLPFGALLSCETLWIA